MAKQNFSLSGFISNHSLALTEALMAYLMAIGTCYLFLAPLSNQLAPGLIIETLFFRVPLVLLATGFTGWLVLSVLSAFFSGLRNEGKLSKIALALAIIFTVVLNLLWLVNEGLYFLALN